MSTFIEFYSIMLGFTNYKLFSDIGLFYPPKLNKTIASADAKITDEEDFNDEVGFIL